MNPRLVNPLISSNIIAPMIFTAVFMFLFIPYAYGAFIKKRKSEYGILMTLGMTEKDVLTSMLFENLTIGLFALAAGMAGGTLFSILFFAVVRKVIGISSVSWTLSWVPYARTVKLDLVVITFTLSVQILGFVKTQIADHLKDRLRGEKEVRTSVYSLIGGCLLSVAAAVC